MRSCSRSLEHGAVRLLRGHGDVLLRNVVHTLSLRRQYPVLGRLGLVPTLLHFLLGCIAADWWPVPAVRAKAHKAAGRLWFATLGPMLLRRRIRRRGDPLPAVYHAMRSLPRIPRAARSRRMFGSPSLCHRKCAARHQYSAAVCEHGGRNDACSRRPICATNPSWRAGSESVLRDERVRWQVSLASN